MWLPKWRRNFKKRSRSGGTQKKKTDTGRHLKAIVGPGPKLEPADLVVEEEVTDVDLAGRPEVDDGSPEYPVVVVNHSEAGHVPGCVVIHTETDGCQRNVTLHSVLSGVFKGKKEARTSWLSHMIVFKVKVT